METFKVLKSEDLRTIKLPEAALRELDRKLFLLENADNEQEIRCEFCNCKAYLSGNPSVICSHCGHGWAQHLDKTERSRFSFSLLKRSLNKRIKQLFRLYFVRLFGIPMLLFVISFFYFYEETDLFKFPFSAEVWGTASDFSMVIVTVITAYWLIKTFEEQKRSTDINSNKDRREIMPVFTVTKVGQVDGFDVLEVKLDLNVARRINIKMVKRSMMHPTNLIREIKPNDVEYIYSDLLGLGRYIKGSKIVIKIADLYFYDIDGRRYRQTITHSNKFNNYEISFPEHLT